MFRRNLSKKILAIALIFTMTFANFAIVTKTYAVSIFEMFSNDSTGTGSKNVDFDTYFDNNGEKTKSIVSDVNSEDLKLYFELNLKEKGYIKNAKISLKANENEELNFEISEGFENKQVEEIENNELKLARVEGNSNIIIELPIEYAYEKFIDLDKISKEFKVEFSGTYVDAKAEEIQLEKNVAMNLTWTDSREFTLDSEITKFFEYNSEGEKYSTLQTLVKIDTSTDNKVLPIKEIKTQIELPKIENEDMDMNISIVPQSTQATNNKENEEVVFDQSNIDYNEEEKILTITTKNEKQEVNIEEQEGTIFEEQENKPEKYFSGTGIDEYLITYTIKGLEFNDSLELNQKITSTIIGYDGIENSSNEIEKKYIVSEQEGEYVSYSFVNETENISKGYMYINYNAENKTEIEYKEKGIINISNCDSVEEINYENANNYYTLKDGTNIDANDIYYKSVSISKENLDKVLADQGKIEILDYDENLIATVDQNSEVNENGYIEVNFGENIDKLKIKVYSPKTDGNLNLNFLKVQTLSNYNKEIYSNIDLLNENIIVKAKYKDAAEIADVANKTITTKLQDTTTQVDLSVNKDSLATLTKNENVELKIELNNQKIESDIFGNSEFEIVLPEYVTNIEITNASLIYADGLELSNVAVENINGRLVIKVNISGAQTALSSGLVTNGSNIIINANIEVDQYAPAKQDEIKLYYTNSESTNYASDIELNIEGNTAASLLKGIKYSAPAGVVSANAIINYDGNGSKVSSVGQGRKEQSIDILSASKVAKMEMVVMNNTDNNISNMTILGRVPNTDSLDLVTEENLGTTLNIEMLSQIELDGFKVYYSEKANATKDLNDKNNNWQEQIENLSNVKSFLIIPIDENYELESNSKLVFSYDFLIPENLNHNEEITGTFATYYNNEEISIPDRVTLTTGIGPELTLETISSAEKTIAENGELKITTKVKNTGKEVVKNVKVIIPIPADTTLVRQEAGENTAIEVTENGVEFLIDAMDINEEKEISINIVLNEGTSDNALEIYAIASADGLEKQIESNRINLEIEKSKLNIELTCDAQNYFSEVQKENQDIRFDIEVKNNTNEEIKNAVAKMDVSKYLQFQKAFTIEATDNYEINENIIDCYDSNSEQINWNIGNIEPNETKYVALNFSTKQLDEGKVKQEVSNIATVSAENTPEYTSVEQILTIGKPMLEITQTTKTTDTYVKENSEIIYDFEVKNVGSLTAESVELVDKVPQGLTVKAIDYSLGDVNLSKEIHSRDEASIVASISPGQTLNAQVTAVADNLGDSEELAVTNQGVANSENAQTVQSNNITHIIEAVPTINAEENESSSASASSSSQNQNITIEKTYKISGLAWKDENENGARDNNEEKIAGIAVILVNSETGIIKDKTTTNSNGEYTFNKVGNGKYLVIFNYDSKTYKVTTYRKSDVASNVNSDAISTTIDQDGKQTQGAVTEVVTIENGSIANIDLGLVNASVFDLEIEKTVNKITVQNSKGTKINEFKSTDLAKVEINAKDMADSQVLIEYNITVKNVGDFAGYAKEIVDYIPEDTIFNSSLSGNESWYTGTDGNIYTKALADISIEPGQSKEVKVILTKQMTEENTGPITNTAEIFKDYNIYGFTDKNSTPGNKVQSENDLSSVDALIGVRTGETFIYISVIIVTMLLGGIAIFISYEKLVVNKRKAGV